MKKLTKEDEEIRRQVYILIRKKDFLEAFSKSDYEIPLKERLKMRMDAFLIEKFLEENLSVIRKIL